MELTFSDLEPNVVPVYIVCQRESMPFRAGPLPMVLTGGGGNDMIVCGRPIV
jgi:hypothetical protein